LKAETRERVKSLGIRNLEVHSYNAMGVKYYNLGSFVDEGLKKALEQTFTTKALPRYHLIIIDESQVGNQEELTTYLPFFYLLLGLDDLIGYEATALAVCTKGHTRSYRKIWIDSTVSFDG
jgi:hypothetical protein